MRLICTMVLQNTFQKPLQSYKYIKGFVLMLSTALTFNVVQNQTA